MRIIKHIIRDFSVMVCGTEFAAATVCFFMLPSHVSVGTKTPRRYPACEHPQSRFAIDTENG